MPHGLSKELAMTCDKNGKVFIDLGADLRLDDGSVYDLNGINEITIVEKQCHSKRAIIH